jgi:hypothetical protein
MRLLPLSLPALFGLEQLLTPVFQLVWSFAL